MVLLRALSRGSWVLGGARSLLLSAPKKLQMPTLSSQFHSFVHNSPIKCITNDASLLRHSSLYFTAFQRFGTSSSVSPDPLGKKKAKRNSMSDADILKAGVANLVKEMIELLEAEEEKETVRLIEFKVPTLAKIVRAKHGLEISMDMSKFLLEIVVVKIAKSKLILVMIHKVSRILAKVMVRTGMDEETLKTLGMEKYAIDISVWVSTHVKGSFAEMDKIQRHCFTS